EERLRVPAADRKLSALERDLGPRDVIEREGVFRAGPGAPVDRHDEKLVEIATFPGRRRNDVRRAIEIGDVTDEEAWPADARLEVGAEEIAVLEGDESRAARNRKNGCRARKERIRRRRRDARAHEIGHERLDETVLIDTEVVDDLVDDALVRLRRADADLDAEERRSVPGAQDESRAAARVDLADPRLIAEVERVARALGGADLDDEELVERAAVPLVGAGRRDDVRAAVEVRDVADEEAGAADAGIEVELEEILTGETREGRAAGDVDDGRDIRDQPVR